MGRPREFDERAVLDATVLCFWKLGYEGTSVRDLISETGLTGASLYNAFGDKRALYRRSLEHYVEVSVAERIRRCAGMAPRAAIENFFGDILERSLTDTDEKGCMLVNAALETSPRDPEFRQVVAEVTERIEAFFLRCLERGLRDSSIELALASNDVARNLLATLMGVRVLARARPDRNLLEGAIRSALSMLGPVSGPHGEAVATSSIS